MSDLPRGAVINTVGTPFANASLATFRGLQGVATKANELLFIVNDPSSTTGDPRTDAGLRAWSNFILGLSLGHLALAYDSVGLPRPTAPASEVPPLVPYAEAMERALTSLDAAVVAASTSGLPTPAAWLNGLSLSVTDFIRVARTFGARFRAGVARTPAERAGVDWARVMQDVAAGITADFNIPLSGSGEWDYGWLALSQHFNDASWHQMTPYAIGMADTAGAFDAWLATARDQRAAILIRSPDRRFPAGDTRALQISAGSNPSTQYYRNRNASGDLSSTWRSSQYLHDRWLTFATQGRVGQFPLITKAELDLLLAEGRARSGDFAGAANIINQYRVTRGGLPAISAPGLFSAVPGGSACVPRVPVAPTFTTTTCGTGYEALKWEKRIATAFTGWGVWYFDARGWGDLPVGTAVHFPVPGQEMVSRGRLAYTLGGVGGIGGAGTSTYGFGSGDR